MFEFGKESILVYTALSKNSRNLKVHGGASGEGASAPNAFENYIELLRKSVFSPPTLSH